MATVIGALAALLSVVAFMPQAWRIIRTRKTDELSTAMWTVNVFAFALWTLYGIDRGAWPIIVPNVICMALSAFILTMKLVSSPTRDAIADKLDPSVDAGAKRGNSGVSQRRDRDPT